MIMTFSLNMVFGGFGFWVGDLVCEGEAIAGNSNGEVVAIDKAGFDKAGVEQATDRLIGRWVMLPGELGEREEALFDPGVPEVKENREVEARAAMTKPKFLPDLENLVGGVGHSSGSLVWFARRALRLL